MDGLRFVHFTDLTHAQPSAKQRHDRKFTKLIDLFKCVIPCEEHNRVCRFVQEGMAFVFFLSALIPDEAESSGSSMIGLPAPTTRVASEVSIIDEVLGDVEEARQAQQYDPAKARSLSISPLSTVSEIDQSRTLMDLPVYHMDDVAFLSISDIRDVMDLREDEILSLMSRMISEFNDFIDFDDDDLIDGIDYEDQVEWASGTDALQRMLSESRAYEANMPSEEEFLAFQKNYPPPPRYTILADQQSTIIAGHNLEAAGVIQADEEDLVSTPSHKNHLLFNV